jgi:hypothetical protein
MVLCSLGGFHPLRSSALDGGTNLDRTILPVWAGPIFRALVSKKLPVPPKIGRMNGFYRKSGYLNLEICANSGYYLD